MFHLAGGGAPGLPAPAHRRLRHGAGRRRVDHLAALLGLPPRRGHDSFARRALPYLRCTRPGHLEGRRCRRGRPQAAGRCAGRWRHRAGGDPGQRGQQRRRGQGGLHRTGAGRPGAPDHRGAGGGRRVARQHRLRRGAWHRHAAGRPHRGGGADPGLPPGHRRHRLLRPGLGQDQHRPPGRGGRRGGPHQDRAGAAAGHLAGQPAFRDGQSRPGPGQLALPRRPAHAAMATRRRAKAGSRQRLRHRRHQCPCGAGSSARSRAGEHRGTRRAGRRRRPAAAAVGAHTHGAGRRAPAAGGLARCAAGAGAARRGLHAGHRPPCVCAACGAGGDGHRRGRTRAGPGHAGRRRRRAARARGHGPGRGVPVPGSGRAAPRHGTWPVRRAGSGGRRVPQHRGPLLRGAAPAAGPGPAQPAAGRTRRRPGRQPAAADRHHPAGALRRGICAGSGADGRGHRAGRDGRPQPGRIRGRLPSRRVHAGRCAGPGGRTRTADAGPAAGRHAVGAAGRRGAGAAAGRARLQPGGRERAGAVRGGRPHRRGRGAGRAAAGGPWPAGHAAAYLARLPLAHDGGGRGADAAGGVGRGPAAARTTLRLQRHRHLVRGGRRRHRALGRQPAAGRALRCGAEHLVRAGRRGDAGGGARCHAHHAGPAPCRCTCAAGHRHHAGAAAGRGGRAGHGPRQRRGAAAACAGSAVVRGRGHRAGLAGHRAAAPRVLAGLPVRAATLLGRSRAGGH